MEFSAFVHVILEQVHQHIEDVFFHHLALAPRRTRQCRVRQDVESDRPQKILWYLPPAPASTRPCNSSSKSMEETASGVNPLRSTSWSTLVGS